MHLFVRPAGFWLRDKNPIQGGDIGAPAQIEEGGQIGGIGIVANNTLRAWSSLSDSRCEESPVIGYHDLRLFRAL